jgi:hypothetical protein
MYFVFISEQTATCVTYGINWLVFITDMKSVYSAIRTGSLNEAVCASSLKGQKTFARNINGRSNVVIPLEIPFLLTDVLPVQSICVTSKYITIAA